ncbi:hypothetical protein ASF50_01860 [Nocardioides sp. Leaf307]|nr:hypothetical protein ASF50_01860 [Nocardioides sp. Leaf307]
MPPDDLDAGSAVAGLAHHVVAVAAQAQVLRSGPWFFTSPRVLPVTPEPSRTGGTLEGDDYAQLLEQAQAGVPEGHVLLHVRVER